MLRRLYDKVEIQAMSWTSLRQVYTLRHSQDNIKTARQDSVKTASGQHQDSVRTASTQRQDSACCHCSVLPLQCVDTALFRRTKTASIQHHIQPECMGSLCLDGHAISQRHLLGRLLLVRAVQRAWHLLIRIVPAPPRVF